MKYTSCLHVIYYIKALYNDIRESILEHVFKNEVKNPLMSDTEKLKHREALNFIEKA